MQIFLFFSILFTKNSFIKSTPQPVVINAPPFSFHYSQNDRSTFNYLLLFIRLSKSPLGQPGLVLIESTLLQLSRWSPFFDSLDNSLQGNEDLEICDIALDSNEFALYSEFTNGVPITNVSETAFAGSLVADGPQMWAICYQETVKF